MNNPDLSTFLINKKLLVYLILIEICILSLNLIDYKVFGLTFSIFISILIAFYFIEKYPIISIPFILYSILPGSISTIPFAKKLPLLAFVDIAIFFIVLILVLKYLSSVHEFKISLSSIEILLFLYIISCFISSIQAIDILRGLAYLRGTIAWWFILLLTLKVIYNPKQINWLFWSLIIWGALLSLIQLYIMLHQGNIIVTIVTKNIDLGWGRSNYIASFYALLIPLGIAMLFTKNISKAPKLCLVFIIVLMITSLLLTGSRGGVVALFIGCLVFLFRLKSAKSLLSFLFLGLIIGVIIYYNPSSQIIWQGLVGFKTSSSVFSRFGTWIESYNIFKDHPIFGVGLGNMYFYVESYFIRLTGSFSLVKAHNLFLELLVETGIIGFIIFTILIFKIMKIQFTNCFRIKEGIHNAIAWGILASTTAAITHSMVEPNILSYRFGLIFWTLAGMSMKQEELVVNHFNV